MKTLPGSSGVWQLVSILAAALALTAGARAQSVSNVGLQKFHGFFQTGATTITDGGYGFNANGGGIGVDRTVTPPGGVASAPAQLGSAGIYYGRYPTSAYVANGLPTLGDGNYTLAVGPHGTNPSTWTATATINLTGNHFPSAIPQITNSGLTWSNGDLILNAGTSYTFNFNSGATFANNGYAVDGTHPYGGEVSFYIRNTPETQQFVQGQSVNIPSFAMTDPILGSYTLASNTLAPGTYLGIIEYSTFVALDTSNAISSTYGGVVYASFMNSTDITIVVVPEPATYALVLAAVGSVLALAMRWRRRTLNA